MIAEWMSSRWRGNAPLGAVFWRDMMLVGTVVNVSTTLTAIGLLALDAPTVLGVVVFLSPLPWNVFLLISVWRSAAKAGGPLAVAAQVAAAMWLLAATTL